MFTCPMVRLALATQFLIDRKTLIQTQPKEAVVPTGIFDLPSGFSVEVAQSLEGLDRAEWEQVIPSTNFFLQWDYLFSFEQYAPENMKFHYVLVKDGKKNLAAFYFQVIQLNSKEIAYVIEPFASGVKFHGAAMGLRHWLKSVNDDEGIRLLISGNNFISGEYGVAMTKEAEPAKIFSALAETVKLIMNTDRNPGKISAVLVKDYFDDSARQAADHLRKKRYHRFIVEPEMIIPIADDWKKFDDYLGAMSKKYRNRAKSVLKKTANISMRELTLAEMEKSEAEIFKLYENVHEKAKFRLALLNESYFTEIKRKFPESFRAFAYEMNGKLVAFRSSFHLETHLQAHFIGMDYAVNEHFPLYQRILYDCIADGIVAGYKEVFLGRTAAEMKSTVGAVAHDLVCYTRHRNSLSNQVIRPFIDYLKPSPWVPRSPFKEEAV